jgi:hypothetical protein
MNWTAITIDHLKASAWGSLVDSARTGAVGSIDPAGEAITDATARVRRAVSTGNVLDADPTKVPNSLKSVTVRLAIFILCERIGLILTQDQRDTKQADLSDLKRISDSRIRVETPDTPDANAEMQSVGPVIQGVNVPRRQTGNGRTSGL